MVMVTLSMGIACQPNSSNTPTEALSDAQTQSKDFVYTVNAPLPDLDLPLEAYEVEGTTGGEIQLPNGTHITVPAAAFEDQAGNPIEGKVALKYREFHNAVDVMLSGIPMQYDSAGEKFHLQSAGMMEIRAQQNGEELRLQEGKEIQVEMASFKEGTFNLYTLEEETGNWRYQQSAPAIPNPAYREAQAATQQLKSPKPLSQPQKINPNKLTFQLDVDVSKYPELAPYEDIFWEGVGVDDKRYLQPEDLARFNLSRQREVRIKPYQNKTDQYILAFSSGPKVYKMIVKPVLEEEAYEKAMRSYKERQAALVSYKQQMEAASKRERETAQYLRSTGIPQLGFYNWDVIIKRSRIDEVIADFQFVTGSGTIQRPLSVYLIVPELNLSVQCNQDKWDKFWYIRDIPNEIVAVSETMEILRVDQSQWKGLSPNKRERIAASLVPTGITLNTSEDLRLALATDL